jgi:hypothetical protein
MRRLGRQFRQPPGQAIDREKPRSSECRSSPRSSRIPVRRMTENPAPRPRRRRTAISSGARRLLWSASVTHIVSRTLVGQPHLRCAASPLPPAPASWHLPARCSPWEKPGALCARFPSPERPSRGRRPGGMSRNGKIRKGPFLILPFRTTPPGAAAGAAAAAAAAHEVHGEVRAAPPGPQNLHCTRAIVTTKTIDRGRDRRGTRCAGEGHRRGPRERGRRRPWPSPCAPRGRTDVPQYLRRQSATV